MTNKNMFNKNAMTTEEKINTVAFVGTHTLISGTFFVKAIRAGKRGDYSRAIYFTLLWMGYNDNNRAQLERYAERLRNL